MQKSVSFSCWFANLQHCLCIELKIHSASTNLGTSKGIAVGYYTFPVNDFVHRTHRLKVPWAE